ncbi:Cyclic di-GMP-binding protein [Pseudidiomarina piscicola]|uniref:Cyclic di-GMP-binding protein n=1 Tax=Pseudidiomarina piscicola TaxID=2614830 RepID=A0A6S6WMK9_9GAMM|nr:cellulose biosynthesis cyclic di-GMP-binding regulatory protein BcsB [Pseudidiomarina piscicola]CAB0150155.1 Cyclic di-GMP-binding protein [Pseudidiomarina piscicola]VZT39594.1 Cyclic di-GMP-binding protein [Pseudomonas aeruginosa]
MKFRWVLTVLIMVLVASTQTVAAQVDSETLPEWQKLPSWQESYSLNAAANSQELRIHGLRPEMTIGFGGRYDRVVEAAQLNLDFMISPAMVDTVSQIRVSMNQEVFGVIALQKGMANTVQKRSFNINPRLFSSYNQLRIELVSEVFNGQCTLASPAAWAEFLDTSELELSYRQLRVANELSYFPEPWFDANDFSELKLNFVSFGMPSMAATEAHGVLASYFGKMADWRSVEVVHHDVEPAPGRLLQDSEWRQEWPRDHAIITLTNDQRPRPFDDLPEVAEPTVMMLANPAYPAYKLLVIAAPNDTQLRAATATFVLSSESMSGEHVTVRPQELDPRDAYAAPRWVSTERPVMLQELVDHPSELQRSARNTAPVNIELRLPPDLFIWQRHGIPLDLRFRYTPPLTEDESRMLVSINDEFVKAFDLGESGSENTEERLRIPILSGALGQEADNVTLPSFRLGAVNRMQFHFDMGTVSDQCSTPPLLNAQGVIDGNSTIDLRGYDNYVALPDVQLFMKTGYPFTRWDDLSQTLVVVPEQLNSELYTTLLMTLAKLGGATGYPATQLTLTSVGALPETTDKDVLIFGARPLEAWLQRFGDEQLQQQVNRKTLAGREQLLYSPDLALRNSGPSAAVVGFQSPFSNERSVVAITATSDSYLTRFREALTSDALSNDMIGFLAVLTPARVTSYEAEHKYYVGNLSWSNRMMYHLAKYPILVTVLALLALLVLVIALYRLFSAAVSKRQ